MEWVLIGMFTLRILSRLRMRFILVGFIWGNVALQRLSALTYYL